MLLAWWSVCALIAAGVGLFAFWPVLVKSKTTRMASNDFQIYQRLIQERERLMANLLDLENDYAIQKISKEDCEILRVDLLTEVADATSKISAFEAQNPVLNRILSDLKGDQK